MLPTLLTLGNGLCGFAAIAYASKITLDHSMSTELVNFYFLLSAGLILAGMVFDALDGTAARLTRTSSEFGAQLDSLCDAVSFGAAPAFLLLRLGQDWNDQPLIAKAVAVISAFYLACTILRLARFNVEDKDVPGIKKFKGLPSPAAGGCVASLAILRGDLNTGWAGLDEATLHGFVKVVAPLAGLVAALLMVSPLPYPHFTRQLLRGRRRFRFIVQILLVASILALAPEVAVFLLFWVYALDAPVRALFRRLFYQPREGVAPHSPGLD
jgi:CDP-diacylglycerol--serine O-phosphatidyltransferase